ncbi:MAG TPA: carbon storage regulator [Pirellulales bacterium]|nr:carbon storage regulator [Pirellulales bacterium]
MLVLSRARGQQIVIADNITVTILEIRGDKIKLGFEGPADVPIHRREVHDRLQREAAGWPEGAVALAAS